jgi:hypothetical protein
VVGAAGGRNTKNKNKNKNNEDDRRRRTLDFSTLAQNRWVTTGFSRRLHPNGCPLKFLAGAWGGQVQVETPARNLTWLSPSGVLEANRG